MAEGEGRQPPKEEQSKGKYIVGATKNPDGTIDYSKALTMHDVGGSLAQVFEEAEQRRKQEREKNLEIPIDVKPGTSEAVWYNLRNTIRINEDAAEKTLKENRPADRHRAVLIEKLKMEKLMLDNNLPLQRLQEKVVREAEGKGEKLSNDAIRDKIRSTPAVEMADAIQETFIDKFHKQEDEGRKTATLQHGHFVKDYPIQDLLSAAYDLHSRLIGESTRGRN